jgi:hypothetical protein
MSWSRLPRVLRAAFPLGSYEVRVVEVNGTLQLHLCMGDLFLANIVGPDTADQLQAVADYLRVTA